ncbi:GntR family transcriptional regulator [Aliishimia ponticola]|uniref:GntR family transcriptional regulator n=1 Tax=Aliishimia ponticola TaxID=2499833 RepID=A0A4S4N9I8_9RHOB|nr:GntR family transcriptional regulator [Aliishimia ponticola]THH35914.1 GntR family transcriptional regulator [Aliishimia ponticola]
MREEIDVFHDLRRRLCSGEFAYGTKLRAEALRKDYDCAASTVRENLLRLSELGLVDFQEQRGFRMPEYAPERQHDITATRIMLESEAACRAMRQGGVEWEAQLSAAHHKLSHIESRMSARGMTEELLRLWSAAELEFHQTLLSACGSPLLMELHLIVYYRYRQVNIEADRALTDLAENIEEHKNILDAALTGDEDLMRRRIYEHFKRHLVLGESAQTTTLVSLAG